VEKLIESIRKRDILYQTLLEIGCVEGGGGRSAGRRSDRFVGVLRTRHVDCDKKIC